MAEINAEMVELVKGLVEATRGKRQYVIRNIDGLFLSYDIDTKEMIYARAGEGHRTIVDKPEKLAGLLDDGDSLVPSTQWIEAQYPEAFILAGVA